MKHKNMRMLFKDLEKNRHKLEIINSNNDRISGEGLLNRVIQIREHLSTKVVMPASRVILIGDYTIDWIATYIALIELDAIIIPIDKALAWDELGEKIALVSPHTVITLANPIEHMEHYSVERLEIIPACLYKNKAPLDYGPENILTMVFSSGTGGKEKLVMLSDVTVAEVIKIYIREMDKYQCQSILNILPLSAIYPLSIVIAILCKGGLVVLSKPESNLSELMKKNTIQYLPAVPMLVEKLYTSVQSHIAKLQGIKKIGFNLLYSINKISIHLFNKNLGRQLFRQIHQHFNPYLKLILSGGAALDKNKLVFLNQIGFNIFEGYGLTELGGVVSVRRNVLQQFGSVGDVLDDIEINIADNQEILIKSKRLFSGYYQDEIATKSAFKDGWFCTGDLGYFDNNHCLHITGRLKEIIVRSDETKQLPSSLEKYYLRSIPLADFAIAGVSVPHHSGDKVVIFVVSTDTNQQEELLSNIMQASQLAKPQYKIDECLFVSELPRNKLGKVCRQKLIKAHYLFLAVNRP